MTRAQLRRFGNIAFAVLLGSFAALTVIGEDAPWDPAPLRVALGFALGWAHGWAVLHRRDRPERAMAVAVGASLVLQLLYAEVLFPIVGMIVLGSFAALRPPRITLPVLGALLGVTAYGLVENPREDVLFAGAVVVAVWALGEARRNRQAMIDEAARRAVTEEQARIARELHDVIAHSVSVIVVQASAADDVFEQRPDQARAALRSIESAGRDALAELRRLLAAVRPDAGGDTQPQPSLERLDELAAPLRSAGLEVALRREGKAPAIPAGVDLSAYRIVQEALTNALRHARATRVEVTVRYASDMLELSVEDDGRGGEAWSESGGHGLVGMRERAAMLGGTLAAGPLERGGFSVHARLPLEARP